nr:ORF1 [Torque teno felis virus]
MAPYRRRRTWRRRWRPRYRRRYPYRRLRKPRRYRQKNRRRVRVFKRRKKLASFFDPVNIAKCTISGFDVGLISRTGDVVSRVWQTTFTPTTTYKLLEGGGVSLRIFDLHYLYSEHRHFKNKWTHTNDGFDLAKYLGTTVYLQPHPTMDYLFFWDTDLKRENPWDIIRMHPGMQINSKNVIFVRNQLTARNTRTKKVKIKPPANILNTWRLQPQWVDVPLFMYGFALINWREPFYRQLDKGIPVVTLTGLTRFDQPTGSGTQNQSVAYSPLVDTGINNRIGIKWLDPGVGNVDQTKVKWIDWTNDLPYWLTTFGQNQDFGYGIKPETLSNTRVWIYFRWPSWTADAIIKGQPGGQTYYTWAAPKEQMLLIPKIGPFIVSNLESPMRINIPFLYRSHWLWGGTQLVQQPITAVQPNPPQVSVKDPGNQLRDLIYPWDISGGLLTQSALRRLVEPGKLSDERRPLPFEERPEGHAYPASDGEDSSETEASEEESNEISTDEEAIRKIRKSLQHERNQRRQLKRFLRSLVVHKTTTL